MLGNIELGEPLRLGGLTLFPLRTPPPPRPYRLAHEAMVAGELTVEEVEPEGILSRVRALSRSTSPALFVEGQELVGAKQDRAVNTSLLLAGGAAAILPVSCIEQGRWSETASGLHSRGLIVSPGVRFAIKMSVTRSLAAHWDCHADQVRVWDCIDHCQAALRVASPTQAWGDAIVGCQDQIRTVIDRMSFADGACGMAIAFGERVAAVDLFDAPETCRNLWEALVTAAALEARAHPSADKGPETAAIRSFLDRVAALTWWDATVAGVGRHRRAGNGGTLQASSLDLDGRLVHLSAIDGEEV